MPGWKRVEYRGYRIEATSPDGAFWRLAVYRLKTDLPAPLRPTDIRYPSSGSAVIAGRREINWLLGDRDYGRAE
jgi:hypothetical protein